MCRYCCHKQACQDELFHFQLEFKGLSDKKYRVINVSIKAKDAREEADAIKKIKTAEKASGTTSLGALLQDKFKEE